MTQNTTPDGIVKWTTSDPVSIVGPSQAMGDSVQAAFNKRERYTYVWLNSTERNAQTGMVTGSRGYQSSDGTEWIYDNAVWRRQFFYLEATATTISLGSGASTGIGSGTAITSSANSTDTDFCSLSTSNITISEPGYYMISLRGRETSDLDITGQLVISTSSTFSNEAARIGANAFGVEPVTVAVAPFFRVTSSSTIYFFFENASGANRTVAATIGIGRLSP